MTINIQFFNRREFAVAKALITFPDSSQRIVETVCIRDRIPEKELVPTLWIEVRKGITREIETWNS